MKTPLEMKPEMKGGLEMKNTLEMNARNELEMNAGNEPEMKKVVEMNQTIHSNKTLKKAINNNKIQGDDNMGKDDKKLLEKIDKIDDENIKTQILNILAQDFNEEETDDFIVDINVDKVKKEVQITTHNYIVGLKFVTTETKMEVLSSIKRDLDIYDIGRFIVRDGIIKLHLNNTNMIPVAYYFLNLNTYLEVKRELANFGIEIIK